MSWKNELKSYIVSVDGSKIEKRNVKVKCATASAGKEAVKLIEENIKSLASGYALNKIAKGLDGYKDFTVKFDVRAGAQSFYDNITAIRNDASIVGESSKDTRPVLDKAKETVKNTVANITGALTGGTQTPAADSVAETAAPETAAPETINQTPVSEGNSKTTILIIVGAALFLLIIGLVIWKTRQ